MRKPSKNYQDLLESAPFMALLNQYRMRYTNKNVTVEYKKLIKQDFYLFRELYPESFVDYCWNYVALGKFED